MLRPAHPQPCATAQQQEHRADNYLPFQKAAQIIALMVITKWNSELESWSGQRAPVVAGVCSLALAFASALAFVSAFWGFQLQDIAFVEAMAAAGFVDVFFAEDDSLGIGGKPVGMGGEIAAMIADGVELGDVFGYGQEVGHGAKGPAPEVHIKAGDDHTVAPEGELFTDFLEGFVKKLGFINAYNIDIGCDIKDFLWMVDGT